MQRVSKGFTIIEVMIFFTVSSVLFASAWGLIAGRQEQVMFDQKVRDTQSKIQQWMSDVSTGVTNGDPSRQYCFVDTHKPYIANPNLAHPYPTNYSPQCTFLGKAIQFTHDINGSNPQSRTLYAYSVFGCRYSGCSTTDLPADMNSANPEPAIGRGGPLGYSYADLTETFDLSPAYVTSVSSKDQSDTVATSHMIGFMNSFNTDNNTSANGSEDLKAYLYTLSGNDYPANDPTNGANATKCLEGKPPCNITDYPPSLKNYQLCLTDGKYYTRITISSASGIGASTKLDYMSSC